jgi:hypothetical protein
MAEEDGQLTQEQQLLQKEIEAKHTYVDELEKRLIQARNAHQ